LSKEDTEEKAEACPELAEGEKSGKLKVQSEKLENFRKPWLLEPSA